MILRESCSCMLFTMATLPGMRDQWICSQNTVQNGFLNLDSTWANDLMSSWTSAELPECWAREMFLVSTRVRFCPWLLPNSCVPLAKTKFSRTVAQVLLTMKWARWLNSVIAMRWEKPKFSWGALASSLPCVYCKKKKFLSNLATVHFELLSVCHITTTEICIPFLHQCAFVFGLWLQTILINIQTYSTCT